MCLHMVDDGGPHSLYCPPACMCVVMSVQQQGPDTGEIDLNNDREKEKKNRGSRERAGRKRYVRESGAAGPLMLGA